MSRAYEFSMKTETGKLSIEKQIFYFGMLSFKLLNKVNLLDKLYVFVNRIDTTCLAIAN